MDIGEESSMRPVFETSVFKCYKGTVPRLTALLGRTSNNAVSIVGL